MVFVLFSRGHWRTSPLFVFVQALQFVELPALLVLASFPHLYYHCWFWCDKGNMALEGLAIVGALWGRFRLITPLLGVHFILKTVEWSEIDVNRQFFVTHLFHARAMLNLVTIFAIIYLALKEPYVTPSKASAYAPLPNASDPGSPE